MAIINKDRLDQPSRPWELFLNKATDDKDKQGAARIERQYYDKEGPQARDFQGDGGSTDHHGLEDEDGRRRRGTRFGSGGISDDGERRRH